MRAVAASRSDTNKWLIAVTVILGTYVAVIDVTIVNVAMPQMMGTFGVSLDAVTWVAVAYSIAEIVMVAMAFWFNRLMGRKNFYIVCIVVFTIASVLSGMARSLEMIIITRILQGLGGGALIPMAQAILLETFPEEEHGTAMAVFMVGVVMAPAMGPVLGGWLTDHYGWPWIFYINIPVGALSLFLVITFLPESRYLQRGLAKIDVVGIILLVIGLTTLQLFLERGEREDWFDSQLIVILAVVALCSLTALVIWELRTEEPVVNLRVLKNVPFVSWHELGLCLWHDLVCQYLYSPAVLTAGAWLFGHGLRVDPDATHVDHGRRCSHRRTSLRQGGQPSAYGSRYCPDDDGIFSHGSLYP